VRPAKCEEQRKFKPAAAAEIIEGVDS